MKNTLKYTSSILALVLLSATVQAGKGINRTWPEFFTRTLLGKGSDVKFDIKTALDNPRSKRPTHVIASVKDLAENKEKANKYFELHPDVILDLKAPKYTMLSLVKDDIPESLQHLSIVGGEHVTEIDNGFLKDCINLITIDLSSLEKVKTIGNDFLSSCTRLTTIDLRSLSNVTQIGDCFLYGCHSLTTIDLRYLSNVTTIGHSFLMDCLGLTTINLSYLSNVTTIGHYFLKNCLIDEGALNKFIEQFERA